MKFKLDENFWTGALALFRSHGYETDTVHSENISGCTDAELFEKCVNEQRCLVTMDLDFSDIIRFPPDKSNGIVVFRLPQPFTCAGMEDLIAGFLEHVKSEPVRTKLWIVEPGRIRIHSSKDE
ncbi:MAG: DUF5615 family PIN-like protein [Candidatus Wallbacteria bacterium]|nr:DUF5615 family PIN-like protein [Candidatus Wallbacteria bacterium]